MRQSASCINVESKCHSAVLDVLKDTVMFPEHFRFMVNLTFSHRVSFAILHVRPYGQDFVLKYQPINSFKMILQQNFRYDVNVKRR